MASVKSKTTRRTANPIETASNPDKSAVQSELSMTANAIKDQFSGTGNDFISQLLGLDIDGEKPGRRKSGEMKMGEMIDLTFSQIDSIKTKTNEKRSDIMGGIDYRSEVLHGSERLSRKEADELDSRIQDIMAELKRIVGSSTILKAEFAAVTVEQKPVTVGKYYLSFFEWLLIELKKIRMKVEDAGAWLSVMKSKKSQRKYGNMAKKHGTNFTLSNERTLATQTG